MGDTKGQDPFTCAFVDDISKQTIYFQSAIKARVGHDHHVLEFLFI